MTTPTTPLIREVRTWLEGSEHFVEVKGHEEPFRSFGISFVVLNAEGRPYMPTGQLESEWKDAKGKKLFNLSLPVKAASYVSRSFPGAPVVREYHFFLARHTEPVIALKKPPQQLELKFKIDGGPTLTRSVSLSFKHLDPTQDPASLSYPFRGLGLALDKTIDWNEDEVIDRLGPPQRKFALEVPHPDVHGIQRYRRFAPRPQNIAPGSVCEAWCYENPEDGDWVLFLTPEKQPTMSLRVRLSKRPRGTLAQRLKSFFMAREIPEEERQPQRVPGIWKIQEALTGDMAWVEPKAAVKIDKKKE